MHKVQAVAILRDGPAISRACRPTEQAMFSTAGERGRSSFADSALALLCFASLLWGFVLLRLRSARLTELALPGLSSNGLPSRFLAAERSASALRGDLSFSEPDPARLNYLGSFFVHSPFPRGLLPWPVAIPAARGTLPPLLLHRDIHAATVRCIASGWKTAGS